MYLAECFSLSKNTSRQVQFSQSGEKDEDEAGGLRLQRACCCRSPLAELSEQLVSASSAFPNQLICLI